MIKGVAWELSYVQEVRWVIKVCSMGSLGSEGIFKGFAGK